MQGRVVKEIGGLFFVDDNAGNILSCKARGKIKYLDSKIFVGDIVTYNLYKDEYIIENFIARKNQLLRPPVVNVDQVVVVLSSSPSPDFMLVDRMIINSIINNIDFVLCVNKSDIIKSDFIDFINNNYQNVVDKIIVMSATQETGLKGLLQILESKVTVLAGQSAVGKSTIANLLVGRKHFATNTLSEKIERGKHTTRHCELLPLDNNGYIIDTPGFTFFDGLDDMRPSDLQLYYSDFEPFISECKFNMCSHIKEPVCGVKAAVEKAKIDKSRYERYIELYMQLKNKWDRKY